MKIILGISAFYHDSAAALVVGGSIIAAAQEERFTREKHTSVFPKEAIRYCLDEGGFTIDELDAVVFYDKPLLKFERLLETYYAFAPRGLRSFMNAIPVWVRDKLFLKKTIYDGLREIEDYNKKELNLLFTEHHLSHAASAFYPSGFEKSAILTIDGVGEWTTAAMGIGDGNMITFLREMEFPHSVGLLYSAFTYYLGFRVNSGEYKMMGLAPYGDPHSEETRKFTEIIKNKLVDIKEDGSIWMNQNYFSYATGLRMVPDGKWKDLFGFARRDPDSELEQHHCNLAYAIQDVTEEIILQMAREVKKRTGCNNLCMAGGVALNCVANGVLLKENLFDEIFIQPAAGDAGGAVGAALAVSQMFYDEQRNSGQKLQNVYLGPAYSGKEITRMSRRMKAVHHNYENVEELLSLIARELQKGKVVGWFTGRMEFGPRALGNRSILADARYPEMQKKLNMKIKFREGFRPFAPAVLAEDANHYFDLQIKSPYMLFTAPVNKHHRSSLPDNYRSLPLKEKLYQQRSPLQAITHVDFSARIQTVHAESNPKFAELIRTFKKLTGCGLLVNTSFNVRGEPIVCTPEDAYRCFMGTEMDILVIENYLFLKKEQPEFGDKAEWRSSFQSD